MKLNQEFYKIRDRGLAVTSGIVTYAVVGSAALAQSSAQNGVGTAVDEKNQTAALFEDGGIFETVVNFLLFLVGAISVIMLIVGGIRYILSAGDQNAVTSAKNTILYAVIGIIVAVLAWAIVNFLLGWLYTGDSGLTG